MVLLYFLFNKLPNTTKWHCFSRIIRLYIQIIGPYIQPQIIILLNENGHLAFHSGKSGLLKNRFSHGIQHWWRLPSRPRYRNEATIWWQSNIPTSPISCLVVFSLLDWWWWVGDPSGPIKSYCVCDIFDIGQSQAP